MGQYAKSLNILVMGQQVSKKMLCLRAHTEICVVILDDVTLRDPNQEATPDGL